MYSKNLKLGKIVRISIVIPYIVERCRQICLHNSLNIVMIYIFKDLKYLSKNLYMNI